MKNNNIDKLFKLLEFNAVSSDFYDRKYKIAEKQKSIQEEINRYYKMMSNNLFHINNGINRAMNNKENKIYIKNSLDYINSIKLSLKLLKSFLREKYIWELILKEFEKNNKKETEEKYKEYVKKGGIRTFQEFNIITNADFVL